MTDNTNIDFLDLYNSIYENVEIDEARGDWYSGKGTYRTTVKGHKVRWDEPSIEREDEINDQIQKRAAERRKKEATARLAAKGKLPIRKPQQNEEFSDYIENLQTEGYDLSDWTWEGIEEFYMIEAKKMKGEDPCWKNYEMVGTKKKGGREVPNCVPKEEFEIDEATAMAKRGYDETKLRKPAGGGEAADRATALENKPTYGDANKQKQRETYARKQRGDFRNTASSNPGLHGYAHKSNDPAVKAKQAARGAQRGALTPAEKQKLNMSYESEFDAISEYLYVGGYADTIEAAKLMAANISEEWSNQILEAKKS